MTIAATLLLVVALTWLSCVDIREFRLPDIGTLLLVAVGILLSFARGGPNLAVAALVAAALGFVSLWIVAFIYHRYRGVNGLGLGDAKLLAAAGAWLGPWMLAPVVFIGAILGLCYALWLRTTGPQLSSETRIPFGPFLSASFLFLWCLHVASLV